MLMIATLPVVPGSGSLPLARRHRPAWRSMVGDRKGSRRRSRRRAPVRRSLLGRAGRARGFPWHRAAPRARIGC